ncbi:MAG: hypothetical protein NTY53_04245, partial [Kiritimatiellaeota bacterium]|nr:hypothetical protein [Kiritimatiellota bacterium]
PQRRVEGKETGPEMSHREHRGRRVFQGLEKSVGSLSNPWKSFSAVDGTDRSDKSYPSDLREQLTSDQ